MQTQTEQFTDQTNRKENSLDLQNCSKQKPVEMYACNRTYTRDSAGDDIVDAQIFVGKFNHRCVNIANYNV